MLKAPPNLRLEENLTQAVELFRESGAYQGTNPIHSMFLFGRAKAPRPRNVVLMIGDGMGLAQVSTRFYQGQTDSHFSRFQHIGLINTSSATHRITDSAASATAYACGERTFNGGIGVNLRVEAIPNLPEIIGNRDVKTGVLATSSITHATPACFYAHASTRAAEETIAEQLPGSQVDFFAAGGRRFFARRTDRVDFLRTLEANGYQVRTDDLSATHRINSKQKHGFLLADEGMPRMSEGRGNFLPHASERAVEYLAGHRKGFFLMIEGSQIDWGGHENDADYIFEEMEDFDQTIGRVLDFADTDRQTLVLVTADHETGGAALFDSDLDEHRMELRFSSGDHSATMVPLFAYGPGAEQFTGIYNNTDLFHRIRRVTTW